MNARKHPGSDSLEKHIDQSPGQPHEHEEQESASPVQDSNLGRMEKIGRFIDPPSREPGDRELLDPGAEAPGGPAGKPPSGNRS